MEPFCAKQKVFNYLHSQPYERIFTNGLAVGNYFMQNNDISILVRIELLLFQTFPNCLSIYDMIW